MLKVTMQVNKDISCYTSQAIAWHLHQSYLEMLHHQWLRKHSAYQQYQQICLIQLTFFDCSNVVAIIVIPPSFSLFFKTIRFIIPFDIIVTFFCKIDNILHYFLHFLLIPYKDRAYILIRVFHNYKKFLINRQSYFSLSYISFY